LPIGSRLRIGDTVLLEITQIGKECHNKCAIYYQAGDCIMPKRGIFARVITGGEISCNDDIQIINH
jgi:MOSC domain-containing protein YiiM